MAETSDDMDAIEAAADTARREGRRWASVPYIEDEPTDRGIEQPCWCTDFHLDVGLNLTYCPRHGRKPDPELWDHTAGPLPTDCQ